MPAIVRRSIPPVATAHWSSVRGANANAALVIRHADLVRGIAFRLLRRMPPNVDVDDLVQTGMVGLLEAAQRYRDSKGSSFVAYAIRRIRGAILDSSRRSDWCPRSVRRRLRSIAGARLRIERENCGAANPRAIAEAVDITLDQYFYAVRDSHLSVQLSLDEPASPGPGRACGEPVDGNPGPVDELMREQIQRALAAAVEVLPEQERVIFLLYHEQDYLMREIGFMLAVSESRVCQIHKQTIERLRAATS
jgi:RNA polymerase sigma factor for flagellar operon FliA